MLGAETDDEDLFLHGTQSPRRGTPDENATATINYTSGHDGATQGRAAHPPQRSGSTPTTFGLHTGVVDRDVYLHTLPMFHCNGWGMPYAITGMGAKHIVLRKVDGAEILRRVEQHGVTLMCGAPRRRAR